MKLFAWRWLAVSSLLLAALVAGAETRPQYGGTLHIATRETFTSLAPGQSGQAESPTQANLMQLVFETLVTIDEHGVPQPALAVFWQSSRDSKRWIFHLHPGVRFHDGTVLTAEVAAASLRAANPSWQVAMENDSVVVDRGNSGSQTLAELAMPRNAIFHRGQDGMATGTGPFRVTNWETGKRLSLAANDDYWGGRPFLDSIDVEIGKSFRDQLMAFQAAKADIIEIAPEQAQRLPTDPQAIRSSLPLELLALVFARDAQSSDEKLLRQALALGIDRNSIGSVLLQDAGQPAGSLLPNWMTGYAFVFSTETDLPQARRIRGQVPSVSTWTLSCDGSDPLSRLIAERIALNARDAGLSIHPVTTANSDLRLMRIPLRSADPWTALESVSALTGLPTPAMPSDSIEEIYAAEQSLLATERILPLFHLPIVYAASPLVKSWKLQKDGSWNLADVWLENKP
jgi:peptide/nickel transport system substrate-binding protein